MSEIEDTMTYNSNFKTPDARFANIHIDLVGPLPPSKGNVYLLTCIDIDDLVYHLLSPLIMDVNLNPTFGNN